MCTVFSALNTSTRNSSFHPPVTDKILLITADYATADPLI
jgi:hypothetical protein